MHFFPFSFLKVSGTTILGSLSQGHMPSGPTGLAEGSIPTQRLKASKLSQHFPPESNSGGKVGGRVGVPSKHCPLSKTCTYI